MPSTFEQHKCESSSYEQALAAELLESQERFDLAMRVSSDGLFDWNLKSDTISFSDRWKEMVGCASEVWTSDPGHWFDRVHPDDLSSLKAALAAHCDGLTVRLEVEYRMRHADGSWRNMFSRGIAIRCPQGHATRLAGSLVDVTGRAGAARLLRMEADLRRAIECGEFDLHYQPIIHIASSKIAAFEALIRWRHPQRGLVMPGDFVAIAEETGLIGEIGKWVLREACRQGAAWRSGNPGAADLAVAVNLSARQFSQADLLDHVQAALSSSGLPATNLILEITESVVMEMTERTAAAMLRLRQMGVKMHIDDFGTGYSSLAYLQDFPVDAMKIDRSFVARLDNKAENDQVVRAIIALARTLNMSVTAEGVETQGQLNHVKDLGCQHIQGYLVSRPLTASAATELLGEYAKRQAPDAKKSMAA